MQPSFKEKFLAEITAYIVLIYGIATIFSVLLKLHGHHLVVNRELTFGLPLMLGSAYIYLGVLLLRAKFNAWLIALGLSALTCTLSLLHLVDVLPDGLDKNGMVTGLRVVITLGLIALLLATRSVFRVRSDMVSFQQAVRSSFIILAVAFTYGVVGFMLLDQRDFHREIGLLSAMHQTVDQFGVTSDPAVAHSQRARFFLDSLSVISFTSAVYIVISFFQPIRIRLQSQNRQREIAEQILRNNPSDFDCFFKLWPHDKHYLFSQEHDAGLAYHVSRGVALVVGDPFGKRTSFDALVHSFQELCYLNDWRPAFVHVSAEHAERYKKWGFRLQKIGQDGVLDFESFANHDKAKYFRHIRNKFQKSGYSAELLRAPFSAATLASLRQISDGWLSGQGKEERGFTMGYYTDEYMQLSQVVVVRDETQKIRGFMNIIPTFRSDAANYDLLRCDADIPGNGADYLLISAVDLLAAEGYERLNLGLSPLTGLHGQADSASINTAMRLVYAKGDRLYHFSGLERFKQKYHPDWIDYYIAYTGTPANFARIVTALNRAMKVK